MSLIADYKVDKWRASWAWSALRGGPGLTVRRFRRTFDLAKAPKSLRVSVSADGRYRLWVNGQAVGRGPLKGTLDNYQYETYDVAPHLRTGRNVIAAEVHWFGDNAPTSEVHSGRPGLLLQGPEGAGLDTPGQWRVEVDRAVQPDTTPRIGNALNFLGFFERVDARALPAGWLEAGFDDAAWGPAVSSGPADVHRTWGEFPSQVLCPRELPMLIEEPRRFARTIRDHAQVEHLFGQKPEGLGAAGRPGRRDHAGRRHADHGPSRLRIFRRRRPHGRDHLQRVHLPAAHGERPHHLGQRRAR